MYVEEEGKKCTLIYRVEGDGLTLSTIGEDDECDKIILEDETWDVKYLYSLNSMSYVHNLALLFTSFSHDTGHVDDNNSVDKD